MKSIQSKTVNITIPKQLLKQIDALAKRNYTSRSDIIRQSLLFRLRSAQSSQLDVWGDPVGEWETVADFREIDPGGVPMEDVLKALKKLTK